MSDPCIPYYVTITLTSVALLISVGLNVVLYLLRRQNRYNTANENLFAYGEEPFRRNSVHSDRFEDDEMERQENPIYGNICLEVGGSYGMSEEMCYEQMSQASTSKKVLKVEHGDVSYASLDLTVNKKRRKKRKFQKQAQTYQAQTHSQPASLQNCQDQDTEVDDTLPSRTSSLMVSRHSIYLNSHQVALEAEERERGRERETDENEEREFEMRINSHEDFDHSLGRSRQSLEEKS
ncbi:uncharacterized protein LOC130546155 [Triplophysa rosa]|nr:uncharacterized protein LOC130546155 [Triplophysa rosa]